jgi:hypothetical protein
MRNAQVSVALRERCPMDGNSGQKRSKGGECDFGRHDTYSSSGCAVTLEISLTHMSIKVAAVLSRQFDLPKARSPGRKREAPVMGMRHAAEAVNSCGKRNGRTKKRDEYERWMRESHLPLENISSFAMMCALHSACDYNARREQEFSLGRVLGEPPVPADMAKSASTAPFEGIKPTHGQSC